MTRSPIHNHSITHNPPRVQVQIRARGKKATAYVTVLADVEYPEGNLPLRFTWAQVRARGRTPELAKAKAKRLGEQTARACAAVVGGVVQ